MNNVYETIAMQIITFLISFSLFIIIPIFILLTIIFYNTIKSPNKIISSILFYFISIACFSAIIVPIYIISDQILCKFRILTYKYESSDFDLSTIRMTIISIFLSILWIFLIKKFGKKTIFKISDKEEENKNIYNFILHSFFAIFSSIFFIISIFLIAYLLDFILHPIISETGETQENIKIFLSNFIALFIPTCIFFIFLSKSIFKKISNPKSKQSIIIIIMNKVLLNMSSAILLFSTGLITREILRKIFNIEHILKRQEARTLIITFIIAIFFFIISYFQNRKFFLEKTDKHKQISK